VDHHRGPPHFDAIDIRPVIVLVGSDFLEKNMNTVIIINYPI
jgi:hypothetical protein